MSKLLFNISHQNTVATITLNQPEIYNAFDLEIIEQLTQYFQKVSQDENIKILIITSNGKHFSAGANLNWMKNAINYTKEQNFKDAKQLAVMLSSLYNINKLVICGIQGNVYGGAIGIVACSDVTIAAKNSKFCFSEVKLGLSPAIISEFVLKVMQINFAKYSMLTAKPFNSVQAYNFGLVHEIVKINQLKSAIFNNIDNLLSLDFDAAIITKQLLRGTNEKIFLEKLDYCSKIIAELRVSENAQLLINNFLNK